MRFPLILVLLPLLAPAYAQVPLASETNLFGIDDGAITPNGALGVVRENTSAATTRIYNLSSGALLATHLSPTTPWWSGPSQDAVELTNTRAVVLGNVVQIIDLSASPGPTQVLSQTIVGAQPRDIAITPAGDLAIVRGGNTNSGFAGGSFVFDLATGSLLASHPGEIGDANSSSPIYSVDTVATNDDYAIALSLVGSGSAAHTRVSVWRLHPTGGASPLVVYETSGTSGVNQDQLGAPHDVTLTPDGRYAAVRSEFAVGLYDLSASAAGSRVWYRRLFGNPGPMGNTSMDSIEATSTRIATASRWTNGSSFGTQMDLFDLNGNQWYARMSGDPHDLVLTPDGRKLAIRTHQKIALYSVVGLPVTPELSPLSEVAVGSTHTFFSAGYDSLQANQQVIAAIVRSGTQTQVRAYAYAGGTLTQVLSNVLPEKPVDLELSPDGKWLVVSACSFVQIYDLESSTLALSHDTVGENLGWYPWCDGVELSQGRALTWGYSGPQSGWVSTYSLFPESTSYCEAGLNSSGARAQLSALGSSSITSNNLKVLCSHLPVRSLGFMSYSSAQAQVPFGAGFSCVAGTTHLMPVALVPGTVWTQIVDYTASPALGGAIQAGQTWNFQFRYRDPYAGAGVFNSSDGLSIIFY